MAGNLRGRLWGGDSSSSNSSSSESEDEAPAAAAVADKKARVVWAEESSSDEEVTSKRKVVSHVDKRYDQMKDQIKLLKNHMKVNDFALVTTDYEAALKMLDKMKIAVEAEGGPPVFFVKAITSVEVYTERLHAEHIENKANKGQRLPENKQKAFNTLRAKVRKGNKAFEDLVKQCKETPEQFEEAAQEEAGSDDGTSGSSMKSSGSSSGSSASDSSSNSDSSDSDSDSSDSDSDSEDSDSYKSGTDSDSDDEGDEEAAREKKMLRWLITPEQAAKNETKKKDKDEKTVGNAKKDKSKAVKTPKQGNKGKAEDKEEKSKEKEEYTPEQLMQKVTEIAQMRGRRQYVRKEYMEKLQLLEEHAVKQGPRAQLYILTSMVSADFDNTGSAFESMKLPMWIEAYEKICKMLPLIVDSYAENTADSEATLDEEDPRSHPRLQELFVAFVEKLDDELYKALQLTMDVYGNEYQDILANSSKFLILLKQVLKFFTETQQTQQIGLVSLRLMEQLYYKPDELNKAVYDSIRGSVAEDQKDEWHWPENSKAFMHKLCCNVFPNGKPIRPRAAPSADVDPADPDAAPENFSQARLHRRASLCQAYHLALHDTFQPARDLLHLGNLAEAAMDSDVHTQILYNRVLAQMGLCAFRLGKIQDAHTFLMDVCMHNKARELLAQGLSFSKNMDRTPEQERAEKMRQLPYHMHINLEVLESAHRICAMLLEVPNLAMQSIDPNNKRIISRVLRRALEDYDKKVFTGPPEDAKEAVVYAAKALQRGDWQCALDSLEDLKLWDHIDPGNVEAGAKVKAMITERIQTEALRTYLFAYSSIYDAFHLDQLVAMFGMKPKLVHSIVSKMMIREEITAFWDESSKYVLVEHSEPTPLQRLALTLADRGAQAVENNERLVDTKAGGYGFNRGAQGQQGQQGRWDQGSGAGGKGRFGKGGNDAKGKGKGGRGKGTGAPRPQMRGWENARAGAIRGNAQRGWATGTTQAASTSRFG